MSGTDVAAFDSEKRAELLSYLRELAAEEPREIWRKETEIGLASGIDEIFHFFFDDNDFDQSAVSRSLIDSKEVESIDGVKSLLEAMLLDLPKGNDAAFIGHTLWPRLRAQAQQALSIFEASE